MFNKRDQDESGSSAAARKPETSREARPATGRPSATTAVIGPSIHVDGKLRGEEDLVIEGKVKGTVELKKNSVTIGNQGDVQADIYAHAIFVDGSMDGNLVAAEQVVIRKSARVKGSIASPRVTLEDGARFNGTIDMDAESEALTKAFAGRKSASADTAKAGAAAAGSSGSAKGSGATGQPDKPAAQGMNR